MANDPPSHLRMGFGYHQARASGLRGLRTDRSPNQVNKIINTGKTIREAEKGLRKAIEEDPEWKRFVRHWISEGLSAPDIWESLCLARRDANFRKRGYRHDGRTRSQSLKF
jgi:hypothetical protein